jgi:hypothetical protein
MAPAIPRAPAPITAGTQTLPDQLATMPVPLDGHFASRPDTLSRLSRVLVPGLTVVLLPDQGAAAPWEWPGSRGKTQCAARAAVHLQQSGAVDLVAWVDASGRASLLDGLAAAGLRAGLDGEGGAERTAARFVAWLRGTTRRCLVVLDDLRDPGDVAGLWPAGPAVITLVTARDPAVVAGSPARVVPVGCYSQREAISALSAWLSVDPDQRSGHLDLVLTLDCEPAAIAQAGAVIATAELTCLSYHELFLRRRAVIEQAAGGAVPPPVVTWILSAEHAEILEPGAGTWPLLVLASLLSPQSMPAAVLTSALACRHLDVPAERARAGVQALHHAGLLTIDHNGPVPAARMSTPLQAAVRASAPPDLVERAAAAAADALAGTWPGDDPRSPAAMLYRSCAAALRSAGDVLLAGGRHHRVLAAAGHSHQAAGLAGPAAAWWHGIARDSAVRCPKLSGQGSNRILFGKEQGSSAAKTETIHFRVQGAGCQEGGR